MDEENAMGLVLLGFACLAGYAAQVVGRRIHVPRVTLLLVVGVLCGPEVLDLVPPQAVELFPFVAQIALAMIGFELGHSLVNVGGRRHELEALIMASTVTLVTAGLVATTLWALGVPLELALILGGISTATAPAATLDVVRGASAEGPLTRAVMAIVALDDVLGVLLFSILLVAAEGILGVASPGREALHALWEVGGAILLGVGLGLPMAWVTGRIRGGELTRLEALGFVLVCGGLASFLQVSFMLACIVLGVVVAKRARRHDRAFEEVEEVSGPLLVIFFLLAGMGLELSVLPTIGLVGGAYVVSRTVARFAGGFLGAKLARAEQVIVRRLGLCLLPQAGVALGLALVAAERLPGIAEEIMTLVVATTVLFELTGPIMTHFQLDRAGEVGRGTAEQETETETETESEA